MRRTLVVLSSLVLISAACGGDDGNPIDAAVADTAIPVDAELDAPAPFVPPTLLSQTGLYSDIATKVIAADVLEFAPRWQLWSDAAEKRRWLWLPPGSQIDTTDMNYWVFPTGTKLWKEFVRGGDRIETRYMEKIGPGNTWADWFLVAFQWDVGATDGAAVPDGVIDDVGNNDIPARSDCRKCHADNRIASVAIGPSALQLDYDATTLDLHQLVTAGRLSAPPTGGSATTPYFPLPAGDLARDALGYLHANCGNCHNAGSDVHDSIAMVLRQDVTDLATWATTAAYETTVDVVNQNGAPGATAIIEPGVPATSALFYRLTTAGGQRMPPVGREVVDPIGTEAVRAWVLSLPPN